MNIIFHIFDFLIHYFQWWLLAPAIMWYQAGGGMRKLGLILGALCVLSIGSDLFSPKTEAQMEAIHNANEERVGNALEE